ncbi:MAG: hypothetical protein AAAB35_11955 [Phyllobacterium sp.]|uniref:hypothetical protein n=1 Tax=Phyllobacterium sp. TaxID=1871046 RepID=UPI0030F01376
MRTSGIVERLDPNDGILDPRIVLVVLQPCSCPLPMRSQLLGAVTTLVRGTMATVVIGMSPTKEGIQTVLCAGPRRLAASYNTTAVEPEVWFVGASLHLCVTI